MPTMVVKISKTYSVEYKGDQYREYVLNSLLAAGTRPKSLCGPEGFCISTEITEKDSKATYAIEVVSDSEA